MDKKNTNFLLTAFAITECLKKRLKLTKKWSNILISQKLWKYWVTYIWQLYLSLYMQVSEINNNPVQLIKITVIRISV